MKYFSFTDLEKKYLEKIFISEILNIEVFKNHIYKLVMDAILQININGIRSILTNYLDFKKSSKIEIYFQSIYIYNSSLELVLINNFLQFIYCRIELIRILVRSLEKLINVNHNRVEYSFSLNFLNPDKINLFNNIKFPNFLYKHKFIF